MFYITEKTSETGKKLAIVKEKSDVCFEAAKALSDKYGFNKWRSFYGVAFGGITGCIDFNEQPDPKIWRKIDRNEYYPRKNVKKGKEIHNEFKNLPYVTEEDLHKAINWDGYRTYRIGFDPNNEHYFGIEVGDDWPITLPRDCKEVTVTEYRKLFPLVKLKTS